MQALRILAVLLGAASVSLSQATIDFTASPTSGKNPLPVAFDATLTGPTPLAIAWNFGDGASGSGEDTSMTSR